MLEDLHRRHANLGAVVVDRAGLEEDDRLAAGLFAARQPLREGRAREAGEKPLAVDAECFLREDAQQRLRVRPVHEARDRAGGEAAETVGIAEDALAECDAALAHFRQLRAEHEPWKIDRELVRRRVGALHVAELALVAEVDDLVHLDGRERADLAAAGLLVPVDRVEERRERRAVVEAHPAGVADVEDAAELGVDRGVVEVERVGDVVHQSSRSAARACAVAASIVVACAYAG